MHGHIVEQSRGQFRQSVSGVKLQLMSGENDIQIFSIERVGTPLTS